MTEWHSSTNTSAADLNVFESLGLLFYIANPATTSFETVEKCPDYVNQVDKYSTSRYWVVRSSYCPARPLRDGPDPPGGRHQPVVARAGPEPGGQRHQHLQRPADDRRRAQHEAPHGGHNFCFVFRYSEKAPTRDIVYSFIVVCEADL